MNLVLSLDNVTAKALEALAPHKSCIDINSPRKLSNAASITKPVASTIANWLADPHHSDLTTKQQDFLNQNLAA